MSPFVNFSIMKRSSGYKPFLYNITADACKFLKNQKSNPVLGYMYGLFKSHSNMNHTCPFDHNVILETLYKDFINNQFTKMLSSCEGDYLFQTHWMSYGILRATIKVSEKCINVLPELQNIYCIGMYLF
ncbi:uncharacterized protein [Drosophila bipectinata]|uniref:uncharacterized protein isoform X4 n=1 Tax=Drosophila bipectinata TaxID=42026 RepID=UPI0038B2E182